MLCVSLLKDQLKMFATIFLTIAYFSSGWLSQLPRKHRKVPLFSATVAGFKGKVEGQLRATAVFQAISF